MKRGYKDSPIGIIPKEWEFESIGNLVEVNAESRNPMRDNPNNEFWYIDIESIEGDSGIIRRAKRIIGKNAPSRARRVIHENDVIMSTVRPYLKAFALVPREYENQICSTGFAVFTSGKKLIPHYLLQTLFSNIVLSQCNKAMMGGQYPALNESQVMSIKIPLPPLPEQKKIAAVLSTVDDSIQKADEAVASTEKLKKGLMQELLTKGIGHKKFKDTEIGRIPEEWEAVRLGDVTKVIVGFVGSISRHYTDRDNGVPLLSTTNITEHGIRLHSIRYVTKEFSKKNRKSEVKAGDIIIARHGASGSAAEIPKEMEGAQSLNVVIVRNSKGFESKYLQYLFNLQQTRKRLMGWKSGAVHGVVNTRVIANVKVALPTLFEQQKLTEILSTVDRKLELQRAYKERFVRIKKGLMNELLTGTVRVKV